MDARSHTDEDTGRRVYTCPECMMPHEGFHLCPADFKVKTHARHYGGLAGGRAPQSELPHEKQARVTLDTYTAGYRVGRYVGFGKGAAIGFVIGAGIVLALWRL